PPPRLRPPPSRPQLAPRSTGLTHSTPHAGADQYHATRRPQDGAEPRMAERLPVITKHSLELAFYTVPVSEEQAAGQDQQEPETDLRCLIPGEHRLHRHDVHTRPLSVRCSRTSSTCEDFPYSVKGRASPGRSARMVEVMQCPCLRRLGSAPTPAGRLRGLRPRFSGNAKE